MTTGLIHIQVLVLVLILGWVAGWLLGWTFTRCVVWSLLLVDVFCDCLCLVCVCVFPMFCVQRSHRSPHPSHVLPITPLFLANPRYIFPGRPIYTQLASVYSVYDDMDTCSYGGPATDSPRALYRQARMCGRPAGPSTAAFEWL